MIRQLLYLGCSWKVSLKTTTTTAIDFSGKTFLGMMKGESIQAEGTAGASPMCLRLGKRPCGYNATGKGKVAQCRGQIVQSPGWQRREFEFILSSDRTQRSLEC